MRSPSGACRRGPGSLCPVATEHPHSLVEGAASGPGDCAEIRAYKLGKKRWSYNQVEVRLVDGSGEREAAIRQATFIPDAPFPAACQDSAVCFNIALTNGHRLQTHLYIVYDFKHGEEAGCPPRSPRASRHTPKAPAPPPPDEPPSGAASSSGSAADDGENADAPAADGGSSSGSSGDNGGFTWNMVTRRECCKGCQGCILRPIKRFGRLGKRQWNDEQAEPGDAASGPGSVSGPGSAMKEPKFMYVSIDEACTHVDAPAFRLLAAVYDAAGEKLLATAVSPPIRVLANNDVPTGAARIPLEAQLPADWEGWAAEEEADDAAAAALQQPKRIRTRNRRSEPSLSARPSSSAATAAPSAEAAGGAAAPAAARPAVASAAAAAAEPKGLPMQHSFAAVLSTSMDLEDQLGQLQQAQREHSVHSVHSRSLDLSGPSWGGPGLKPGAAAAGGAAAQRPSLAGPVGDEGACMRSFAGPTRRAGSPLVPLSRWQAPPTSDGSGSGGGTTGSDTPLAPLAISAAGPGSFSSAAEHDSGPTSVAAAAWAVAAAALHPQQLTSPPTSSLPANLGASTAWSTGEGSAGSAAMLPAEYAAAWQQQLLLQRRQRLAAARMALQERVAAQQQWGMQQAQQPAPGMQPLPSPTDSDASAAFNFGGASPAAAAQMWAGPPPSQSLPQQLQQRLAARYAAALPGGAAPLLDPRGARPAPITTGAPAPVLAAAASAFTSGAQDWRSRLGAAPLPLLQPLAGPSPDPALWPDQLMTAGSSTGWPSLPQPPAAPSSHPLQAHHLLEHSQAMLRAASAAVASRGGLLAALHSAQQAQQAQQLDDPWLAGPGLGGSADAELIHVSLRCPSPGLGAWPPAGGPAGGPSVFDSLNSIFDDVPSAPFGLGCL
ncbi:hypothetical protein ABPG75_010821 [Micractinium tetrahymenae]